MRKRSQKDPRSSRKISEQEAVDEFIALHAVFAKCWKEGKDDLGDLATHMIYVEFAIAVAEVLKQNPREDFGPTMQLAEKIIRDGNDEARESVCIWFIESLLGVSDKSPELLAPVLKQMGPLSRKYALEENEFSGRSNLGLER